LSDPVSWLLIEKGWQVVDRDGRELGTVHEVVGDTDEDIFNGLAVSPGFLHFLRSPHYVPAERVAGITEGAVALDLDRKTFKRLDKHGEIPPSARVRADTTDLP
jgi:sporulation protein YlmC with PRC-barrel domain